MGGAAAAARVIVTRPTREAGRWVDALRAHGLDAVALPLLAIEPAGAAARQALREHWARAGAFRAFMFVSAAAVNHFFEQKEALAPVPYGSAAIESIANGSFLPRCWATGPGTVRALRRAGVPDSSIEAPPEADGRFDSEALWSLVRGQLQPGDRVLVVRGGDALDRPTGRGWLAAQIEAAGAVCEQAVAYRRLAPAFGEPDARLAESAAREGAIWLFSSSEAIAHLLRWQPALPWRSARAVATHERIAQAARDAGFGTVLASAPTREALLASIESLR